MENVLQRLRARMKAQYIDAYLVPNSDFHDSEYVGAHFRALEYCSGFTGSAGTLALTDTWAGLWTDARYFLQAEQQLMHSGITLYRMGEPGVPEPARALCDHMPHNGVLGADGRTLGAANAQLLRETLGMAGFTLALDVDLVGDIWEQRPPLPDAGAYLLAPRYAGRSAQEKLCALREAMAAQGASMHLLTTLDDIAWLFNLRGSDIAFCPVLLSYALIGPDGATLFTHAAKLPDAVRTHLGALGVTLAPYDAIYQALRRLPAESRVLLSRERVNAALVSALPAGATVIDGENPTTLAKTIKNGTELANLRLAHLHDGIALTRFLHRVKTQPEGLTERSAAALLTGLRMEQQDCTGESFATIAGYGPHGAIVHYRASEATDVPLKAEGFFLIDSGGQYFTGTTDVTRTIALGPLSAAQKRDFTLVLQGMLRLAHTKFPAGCCGYHLDAIARGPLWAHGLDYKHGTGHGIGYFLNVHERPVNVRWFLPHPETATPLAAGMVFSDEPGVYRAGEYGIRLENQLACIPAEENAFGTFLAFDILTLAPLDLDAIEPTLLSQTERDWLNAYHARVYEALAPCLLPDTRQWLAQATRAI